MRYFIDSANLNDIKNIFNHLPVNGVTTNPTLLSKSNTTLIQLKELNELLNLQIHIQLQSTNAEAMYDEAQKILAINKNFVIKIPMTDQGLIVHKRLKQQNVTTNFTLCFSLHQAWLAAHSGADYMSFFIGRTEDHGYNVSEILFDIQSAYEQYQYKTKIIVASIRTIEHINASIRFGADIATIPPVLFSKLCKHVLTQNGLIQ